MAATRPLLQNMRIDGRRAERDEVSFRSELREGAKTLPVHVVDISPLGFRARCETCAPAGSIQLGLPGLGFISARVVWAVGGRIGGEFARPIDAALYRKMLDCAPEQESWHD